MISIVINCDTRPEKNNQDGLMKGVVDRDFLDLGIYNKIKFFEGFDIEVIVFIDEHNPVAEETLKYLRSICDCVVVRKHTDENKFNDNNYISALQLARGEIVCHFDQDVCAFSSSQQGVKDMVGLLEKYDYISYPSHWTPNAAYDNNYDYSWCSTRFFMCKIETLDFTEIKKCLDNSDYLYGKYPASVKNPWVEHILGLLSKYNGKGVYYPPINLDKIAIFTWGSYEKWTLRRLNELPFEEINKFINSKGGIQYPMDVFI